MAKDKMTLSDFAAKVDNEGGLYKAVTSYGLTEDDLDPNEVDEFTYNYLAKFVKKAYKLRALEYDLEDLLLLEV